ncbi:TlpA family protein disulfide reductase [Capnocytophaga cynodegmi]|uniref:TlpA family protein disulfide reductase n=1 Tax=Capnocytophaga cynodegmi TaxID=28189 RepID=UPI00036231FB|nr:TlpA disulfide reductase family protein [Capnocytophaga cynodegmi]CEN38395.1 Thiol-disulfide oxidoreductase resA [Capnocytophaga cynodegmi]
MKNIFLIIFSLISLSGLAQMTFSERVEYSELATPKDKSLFFVDFWATWCVPCVHVSSYLNTIQEQFREDLYIVSLTQERSDVVRSFLERHPTKLAVSIDYEGQNFKQHNVRALPYGILFNANGEILWKGNPANITSRMIRSFASKNKQTTPIYDFLKYSSYENEEEITTTLDKDFEIREANIPANSFPVIERINDITSVKGSLPQIIAYLLKVSEKQVTLKDNFTQYQLLIQKNFNHSWKEKEIAHRILKDLGYTLKTEVRAGKILEIHLPESTSAYWNKDQIDWGTKNPKFLVDESQFSADNISVNDFLYKLSDILETPINIKNTQNITAELFDWQLHYQFSDLMLSNLSDLGIEAKETSGNFTRYFIEK